MEILYSIFVAPFIEMGAYPDLFIQALWDGFVKWNVIWPDCFRLCTNF